MAEEGAGQIAVLSAVENQLIQSTSAAQLAITGTGHTVANNCDLTIHNYYGAPEKTGRKRPTCRKNGSATKSKENELEEAAPPPKKKPSKRVPKGPQDGKAKKGVLLVRWKEDINGHATYCNGCDGFLEKDEEGTPTASNPDKEEDLVLYALLHNGYAYKPVYFHFKVECICRKFMNMPRIKTGEKSEIKLSDAHKACITVLKDTLEKAIKDKQ